MTSVVTEQKVRWVGAEPLLASLRPVNVFCGGYGSGKTEVAVNFAIHLAAAGHQVKVADLDIVNPYFRSREVRAELRALGIEVLVPEERLVGADLPIVQPEAKGAIERPNGLVVLDLGGDLAGARIMSSLSERLQRSEFDAFYVLNSRRPFASKPDEVKAQMAGIEAAAGLKLTGLVINSHLADETDSDTVAEGVELAEEVSRETKVRLAFVAVERSMLERLESGLYRYPVMVLDRMMLKPWEERSWLGKDKFKL